MKKVLLACCLITGITVLPLIPGCSNAKKESESGSESTLTETVPQDSEIAARVNGDVIPRSELERAVKNVLIQNGMDTSQTAAFMDQFGPRLLDQLIGGKLLYQEAVKNGFIPDQGEVDEVLAELSGRHASEEEFQSEMEARGFTEEILKKAILEQLTIQKYVQETIVPMAVVPEDAVRTAYDQNPGNFERPEEVRASHILVKVEESDSQDKKDEALEKAKDIATLARQKDADFAALAVKHSEGPSAPDGGDLGFFRRGQMVKPFEDKAFSMKVGEVSDPVLTKFGYHIIKLTDHKESAKITYEEVHDKLAADLKNRMVSELVKSKVDELKAKSEIEILFKPSAQVDSTLPDQN